MRFVISLFFILICAFVHAQQADNNATAGRVEGEQVEIKTNKKFYDPKKASRRSAIFPGWGQIYNDSWWKVPILYTGLGVAIHFIGVNEERRDFWLNEADLELAKDTPNDNLLRIYRRRADSWRKNRDLVFLTIAGIYALQIVEAAVDAHLKGFNVDENLALNIKPKVGVISNGAAYLGFGVTLPIGR